MSPLSIAQGFTGWQINGRLIPGDGAAEVQGRTGHTQIEAVFNNSVTTPCGDCREHAPAALPPAACACRVANDSGGRVVDGLRSGR